MSTIKGINSHSVCFAAAFQHASGKAPNASTKDDRGKFNIYYKCLVVLFLSLRRVYRDQRLVLISDQKLPPFYSDCLDCLTVEQIIITPTLTNLSSSFPGCLFTLSLLERFREFVDVQRDDLLVILDPDCVIRAGFDDFLLGLGDNRIGAYSIDYPLDRIVNGYTRNSLGQICSDIFNKGGVAPIKYYGGEFFAFPVQLLDLVNSRVKQVVLWIEENGESSNSITEEHVLSLVLNALPERYLVVDAARIIKRVWTSFKFRNVTGQEELLRIWHLPAEKKRGLRKVFEDAISHGLFQNYSQDDFEHVLKRRFPVAYGEQADVITRGAYLAYKAVRFMLMSIRSFSGLK